MTTCRRPFFALVCASWLIALGATAQNKPVPNAQLAAKPLNARVESLLKKMTLEEKIGQLVQFSAGFATGPGAAASNTRFEDMAAKGQVGSFFNVVGADATNHYQHIAMEKTRLHIPLIFGLDVIHGDHTVFPVPLAVAASWDPAAAELVAHTGAVEARADGIPWVFSPMVDIARDPRWGRVIESNGEDPYLSSAMARAWVRGYQQGDLSKPDSAAVSVKHYAAYGAAIAGRDYNATDMSDITLRQVYLEPYRAAVEEGAATLMSSFNSINGVPATANPLTLNQILRKEWGFDGFVVSDWGAVAELINHSIGDGPTVARKALEAGVDMDMEGNLYGTVIIDQVRAGKIPESVVDEAVRRILRVKFALGLFDHPYVEAGPAYDATPERRALTRKVADETMVLLKNPGRRPDYYLQNFHFQSGGWMTDDSAERYDTQVEVLFKGTANAMRRQALPRLFEVFTGHDQRALRLIDLGCGTGRFLDLVKQAWPRLPSLGLDLSEAYIRHARRYLRRWSRLDLVVANAEAIPAPDNSVDAVASIFMFHELPPKVRRIVIRECERVLKPGGRLILLDSLQSGDKPAYDGLLERFPQNYHEPYYRSYVDEDFPAIGRRCELTHRRNVTTFVSKVMVFDKPAN